MTAETTSDPQGVFGDALRHHEAGRLEEAERLYRQVSSADLRYADSLHMLGVIRIQSGRPNLAADMIRKAISINPEVALYHSNLGNALQEQNRLSEAVACYRKALDLKPEYPEALNNLGGALKGLGKLDEAVACYRGALLLKRNYPEACSNLGNALRALGRLNEAIESYRTALDLKLDAPEGHNNLGTALREWGKPEEAVACHRKALLLKPDYADAHYNLGNALQDLGRLAEAESCYLDALRIKPDYAVVHNNLGLVLMDLGRLDEARLHLAQAIDLAPDKAFFHFNMADTKRFGATDPQLFAMERIGRNLAKLPTDARIYIHFALGKAYDDLGEHKRSFHHLRAGNALKRHLSGYDEAATLAQFERFRASFTSELIKNRIATGEPTDGPIFIVGMPRSGTTLAEQILASHRQVFGAGELDLFAKVAFGLADRGFFPEALARRSDEDIHRLGATYLASLRAKAPGTPRITDKTLQNFMYCGLIGLALPNARIIHMRRDPVDTCLSCFSKLFSGSHPYAYDLGELGRYYRGYDMLMEHWRAVLPEGLMLEVRYEDVVNDLEGQARRILAHCGLEWDESCLAFHKTRRPVRTASAIDVRKPIYRSSVGRWHVYRELAAPLLASLYAGENDGGDLGDDPIRKGDSE